ncbi:ParB/RepB/Spo0J family partition protein [Paraburkholderia humisilvae]|uniref:Nucleoid occlusion protein n=1 Tax=Paraburkholderia humisilvae TaxID=627669 RepID=A0A6J5DQN0_9BURK|nr:ParB/RepB/Spo0J family partition protein [Paraburkholderia humisilvae]CAB3755814.1 Nucleoid occlusion protein [Paraburkholderia humisilvae]
MSTLDLLQSLEASTAPPVLVDIDLIDPDPDQPRQEFYPVDGVIDEATQQALVELADSITQVGLLQPITIREKEGGRYKISIGERRWRAFRLNNERGVRGSDRIPSMIRNDLTAEQLALAQLAENLQRKDLSDRETAKFLKETLEKFPGLQKQQLAKLINQSSQYISRILALLDPQWADVVDSGIITYASLLEQYRALPRSKQRELKETAQRENRALTSGDIRSAKSAVKKGAVAPVQAPQVPARAVQQFDPILARQVQEFVAKQAPKGETYQPSEVAMSAPAPKRQIFDSGGDAVIPAGVGALNPAILEKREARLTLQQIELLLMRGALVSKAHLVSLMLPVEEIKHAITELGMGLPADDAHLPMALAEAINRSAR